MKEIWKAFVGYRKDRKYEVSNRGCVKATVFSSGRYSYAVGRRLLAQCVNPDGYLTVLLRNQDLSKKRVLVHVLVAKAFHGAPPTLKHEVNHKDLNKKNNCDWNLEWVTSAENKQIGGYWFMFW